MEANSIKIVLYLSQIEFHKIVIFIRFNFLN